MGEEKASDRASRATKRRLVVALRFAVAFGALGWTLSRVSLAELAAASCKVSAGSLAIAIALMLFNLVIAAARSRVVLYAYGSEAPPSIARLSRVHWIGLFYNTFLPGNLGGDVLRAHATRDAFGAASGAAPYVIVAIERVFGLAGLLGLAAAVLAASPIPGVRGLPQLAVGGLAVAVVASAAPVVGRRFTRLPGRLGSLAATLPPLRHPWALTAALAMSVGTQTLVALTGYVLVAAVAPATRLTDALVLVPLASVVAYFPATIAGLGVREAAFVALFTLIGVARADATAASLAFLAAQLAAALGGGLVHLITREPSPRIAAVASEGSDALEQH